MIAVDSSAIMPDPFFKPDERPYVGLRAFGPADRRYFCGRSTHIVEIRERLNDHRLVAVVGLSGSGKSSLVRAGVIPELRAGRLKNSSSDWLIAMATPANEPLKRMGDELIEAVKQYCSIKRNDKSGDAPTQESVDRWAESVHQALKSGSLGLAKAIATVGLSSRTRILLVVDQFEELFRYWKRTSRDGKDEVEVFVQQLLELTSDPDDRVYVVITMRSEYLGDCARYEGLAEAVNAGLYLTPRLNRDQLREAIELPAQRCHRQIAPDLVQRLLNDVANDQDQLPVLQHALMRCWEKAVETNAPEIDNKQYEIIGGLQALDVHAEEIYKALGKAPGVNGENNQKITELLFKRITKRAIGPADEDRKTDGTRDATKLATICLDTGFSPKEIIPVINVFRERNCAFLRPGEEEIEELNDESMIDITHESLIRKWKELGRWVQAESNSADLYMRLSAEAIKARPNEFLSQSELDYYNAWQESKSTNEKWAQRYGGDYDNAIKYLARSRKFRKHEKWKHWGVVVGWPAIIVFIVALIFWDLGQKSREQQRVFEFIGLSKIVSKDEISTTHRVPAAISLALAAETGGTRLQQELPRQVRLDQWELFSAIHRGKSLLLGKPDVGRVESSCGVAVDRSGRFVALASGNNLRIWELARVVRTPPASEAKSNLSPSDSVSFEGVDCVRFSPEKEQLQLIASSYSYKRSREDNRQSEVRRFAITNDGHLKRSAATPIWIDAPISLSFLVTSERIAVLTLNKITVYTFDREPTEGTYSPEPIDVPVKVQAGFFSLNGSYLIISCINGHAYIYDLQDLKKPPKKLDFGDPEAGTWGNPDDMLQSVAFSTDLSRIVTGSLLGWVGTEGNPFAAPKKYDSIARMRSTVTAAAFGKHGRQELIAAATVAGDAAVFQELDDASESLALEPWLLDLRHGYRALRFTHQGTVTAIGFANDGSDLVTASEDQKARVIDISRCAETVRVPHDSLVISGMVFSRDGKRDDILVSASQDANLQVTDLSEEYPTVIREWQPHACPSEALSGATQKLWPSVVSAQGLWRWACGGKLEFMDDADSIDEKRALTYGDSINNSMKFSQTGSSATWLDLRHKIHYAEWNDKESKWIQTETSASIDSDEPQPIVSPTSTPVLTLSSDGKFVGISFTTKDNESVIEVFKVNGNSHAINLEQLRNQISKNKAPSNIQLKPYGIDVGKKQVLSLAVSSRGSIAAGTTDGSVFRLTRQPDKWLEVPLNLHQDIGLLGQGPVINAVAFTGEAGKGDGNLLVARGDSSIWLFSASGEPLYPEKGKLDPLGDAPARTFVFSNDGKRVAAVAGAFATMFVVRPDGLTKGLALQEPGFIQSMSLSDYGVAFTSVVVRDSLVRIKHNLKIERHVEWICDKQPTYQDENSPEEINCKRLRELLPWVPTSCFWAGNNGKACSSARKN